MKRIRQDHTPRALGALALAGATGLLASSLVAHPHVQEPKDSKVQLTRAAMEKYVTLRGAIGKEKARLAEDEEFLADQIAILTEQVAMERATPSTP